MGTASVMLTAPEVRPRAAPARVSLLTGELLLSTAVVLVGLHVVAGELELR